MKTIYGVYANSDNVEGKGVVVLLNIFTREQDAYAHAKGQGPMGMSDGDVRPLYLLESLADLGEKTKKERIDRAISKLSQCEIEALGIEHLCHTKK
jgi:hypothetical protein